MSGLNLNDGSLGKNLAGTKFIGSILTYATFFDDVNLRGANFSGVLLNNAVFAGKPADNKMQPDLSGTIFDNATAKDVKFIAVKSVNGDTRTSFKNARLAGSDFSDSSLTLADFDGSTLTNVKFNNTWLANTIFTNIKERINPDLFKGAANLSHADLSGVNWHDVNFSG